MISDTSFIGLELLKNDVLKDHDQVYDEVTGFEPLRKTFKKYFWKYFSSSSKKSPYSLSGFH